MELSNERLAKILAAAEDGVGASAEDTRLLARELAQARKVIEVWSQASARVCEEMNHAMASDPDGATETGARVAKTLGAAAEDSLRILGT